jgi:hypothetical protein
VLLALLAACGAAAIAVVRGGSLQEVANTHFSWTWLLFLGLGLQLGFEIWTPEWLTRTGALIVTLGSIAAVLAFLMLNRSLPGLFLAAVGLTLNVIVIAANGAMPVSLDAVRISGIDVAELQDLGVKHEVLGPDTIAPWLADVLTIPKTQQIFSLGDVVLGAGLAHLVYARARSKRRRRHAAR